MAEVGFTLWDLYDTYTTLTDPCASGSDKLMTAGGALLGLVAPGGGYGTGARLLDDALDVTSHRKAIRKGLAELTGEAPAAAHAHHMFPVKHGDKFAAAGIDVNDPRYGAWWGATSHLQNARGYNEAWGQFLDSPTPRTADEIYGFGKELAGRYGLTVNY